MKSYTTLLLLASLFIGCLTACSESKEATDSQQTTVVAADTLTPEEKKMQAITAGPDSAQMQKAFTALRKALVDANNKDIEFFAHKNTYNYFAQLKNHSLSTGGDALKQMNYFDKQIILFTRLKSDATKLNEMEDGAYFQFVTRNGIMDKTGLMMMELGTISHDAGSDQAQGTLVINGREKGALINFIRQGGIWTVDLSEALPIVSDEHQGQVAISGVDGNSMLMTVMVAYNEGKAVPNSIWNALQ